MARKNIIPSTLTLLLLFSLVISSEGAVSGAKAAMHTCAAVLIPCLFPFFTVSLLMSRLGLPHWLGTKLQGPMAVLFGVSGTGAGVFILGILGGYPLGAAVIADLLQRSELDRNEAKKLLAFCNNSGPAFLIGAAGIGVFHSSAAGLLLYGVHILSAVITGLFLSGTRYPAGSGDKVFTASVSLSDALPEAIGKAAAQMVQICGYVIFFGAVTGVLEAAGLCSAIYGALTMYTPLTLSDSRALCMGLLELGCGIGALSGAPLTPQSLALCSFLTGFGGLSVCFQTMGVLQGTGIGVGHHLIGRLCCGGIGAFLTLTIASILL